MDEVVSLEAAPQGPHVADAREALGNRKRLVREHVEARGRRGTLGLVPENLRERDGAAIVFVGKDAENHAVLVLVAQRLGTAAALRRRMVRIVAAHIGIERALLRTRIGRLVVRHAARRHEQRDDGINECRFARADIARQERRCTREVERPYLAIERAPVVDLEPLQAEAELRQSLLAVIVK